MDGHLIAFLRAWLDWAEAGAPDSGRHTRHNPCRFEADCGLCANADNYEELQLDMLPEDCGEVCQNLNDEFAKDGLDTIYPFGKQAYEDRSDEYTQHKHEPRLAWVRSKLAAVNVAST